MQTDVANHHNKHQSNHHHRVHEQLPKSKALRLRAKEHTEVCDWARASTSSATIESNVFTERSRSATVGHLWYTADSRKGHQQKKSYN